MTTPPPPTGYPLPHGEREGGRTCTTPAPLSLYARAMPFVAEREWRRWICSPLLAGEREPSGQRGRGLESPHGVGDAGDHQRQDRDPLAPAAGRQAQPAPGREAEARRERPEERDARLRQRVRGEVQRVAPAEQPAEVGEGPGEPGE